MEGVKTLDVQRPRIRRRRGNRTRARLIAEQERSVSARKRNGRGPAVPRRPVAGTTYKRWPREGVVRRAEVGAGHSSDHGGESPLERRACRQVCALAGEGLRNSCANGWPPASLTPRTSTGAWPCGQPVWRRQLPRVGCLGESRMSETFMSGLGRGCWKRTRPDHGGERRGRTGTLPPVRYPPTTGRGYQVTSTCPNMWWQATGLVLRLTSARTARNTPIATNSEVAELERLPPQDVVLVEQALYPLPPETGARTGPAPHFTHKWDVTGFHRGSLHW
jgi:hypothetical protein